MPTTITKSIGTTGRDYSTLQAWEDAMTANLVTADEAWVGECHNDSEFTGAGNLLTIDGHTTDSTRTITLKCASGKSFRDNGSVQTNALRYNASNGVGIRMTGDYAITVIVNDDDVTLQGLQIKTDHATGTAALKVQDTRVRIVVDFCILHAGSSYIAQLSGTKARNCLFMDAATGNTSGVRIEGTGTTEIHNCTLARTSGTAGTSLGVDSRQYNSNALVRNTAVFGFGTASGGLGTFDTTNSKNNASDLASGLPGSTGNVYSLTFSSQFENVSTATADLRAKSGGGILDVGFTDTTNGPNDIAGTARPSGSAYDIGCWELVAAAGGLARQRLINGGLVRGRLVA